MNTYRSAYSTFMIFMILGLGALFAQPVPEAQVMEYARNFLESQTHLKSNLDPEIIPFQKSSDEKQTVYTYVLNFEPEGWMLMSADQRVEPVLAYSPVGRFDIEEAKDLPFYFWFEDYSMQIEEIIKTEEFGKNENWFHVATPDKSTGIEPLIKVKWNQNNGWNSFCPADEGGPGGRAYAGCVAVAMAQNMSVYKHPKKGYGSKTHHSKYGPLTANFGETTYRWDLTQPAAANEHSALILYHLAISVSMGFDASGSGAYSRDVPAAIKTHFDYSNSATMVSRRSYSEEAWMKVLEDELKKGRPIYYAGNANNSEAGHAFNLDGMDGSGRFHFNWGWSGSYDGYYYISNLNPGSTNNFSHNQEAIINFIPRDHSPQDINLSKTSVKEGLPTGTVVGTFTVVDETPNDSHTFEVHGPESVFGFIIPVPFAVEDNKLITTKELDFNLAKRYEILVTATDLDGLQYTKSFFVDVEEDVTSDVSTSVAELPSNEPLKVWSHSGQVYVRLNSEAVGDFNFVLYDITGKRIIDNIHHKTTEDFSLSVNPGSLPDGIYFVTLDLPGVGKLTRKFYHRP
jgi:hypothetical protein